MSSFDVPENQFVPSSDRKLLCRAHSKITAMDQNALQETYEQLQIFQEQNQIYQRNFEQLKVAYDKLEEKLSKTELECHKLNQEKSTLDTYIHDQVALWKDALEAKEREMEAIKQETPRKRELELVRLKVAEDFAQRSEQQWTVLRKELDDYRQKFFQADKEKQQVVAKFQREEAIYKDLLEEAKFSHEAEFKTYQKKLDSLQVTLETATDVERLRICQRDKHDLELRCKALVSENEEIRAEKENLRVTFEQQERVSKKQIAEINSVLKSTQSETESMRMKINSLDEQVHELQRTNDQLLEKNSNLVKEFDSSKSRGEERCHEFNLEVNELKVIAVKERNKFENEIKEQEQRIEQLEMSLSQVNDTLQRSRQSGSDKEKEFLQKIRIAREEEWAKISKVESEKSELSKTVAQLHQKVQDLEAREDIFKKESDLELQKLKDAVRLALSEKESLSTKNTTLSSDRERFLTEITTLRSKWQALEQQFLSTSQECEKYRQETGQLNERILLVDAMAENSQKELDHLKEQLQKETDASRHNLERMKTQWTRERVELKQTIENLLRENTQTSETSKQWEEAFGKQQKIYLDKVNQLKIRVRTSKNEAEDYRKALEKENAKTQQQMEEIRVKQSHFLQFLQTEMTN